MNIVSLEAIFIALQSYLMLLQTCLPLLHALFIALQGYLRMVHTFLRLL